jgi:hypothetical protein
MRFNHYIYLLFVPIVIGMAGTALAQPNPNKKDAIEVQKVAYITNKLNLTTTEAQQFWPLYNEYQQKRDNLKIEQRKLRKEAKENFEGMTDKEIETFIDKDLEFKQKELDLAMDFHKKMKTVLSMKKVALYYKAVEEFNRSLADKVGLKGGN